MRTLHAIILALITIAPVSRDWHVRSLYGRWTNGTLSLILNKDNSFQWEAGPDFHYEGVIKSITDHQIQLTAQGEFEIDFRYACAKTALVIWTYKTVEDSLGPHLDEITLLQKSRVRKSRRVTSTGLSERESFHLPADFTGMVFVCYNQEGSDNIQREGNTRKIRIPEDGRAKTAFIEAPLTYGLRNYTFTGNGKEIPYFSASHLLKEPHMPMAHMGLSGDSVYVCLYGFNQTGRRYINEVFNEDIQGNVLMFAVDTLHNILSRQYRFFDP